MFSAIILAAGMSTRMNGQRKQFAILAGKLVLQYSIDAFLQADASEIIIATNYNYVEYVNSKINNKKIKVIAGGKTRQESARLAFAHCNQTSELVLIHDAARPFIQVKQIKKLVKIASKIKAATLATFACDTVKIIKNNFIQTTINRDKIALIQTPQAFSKKLYKKALKLNPHNDYTDDCQLIEKLKHPISLVKGSKLNFKITTPHDLMIAEIISKNINLFKEIN